MSKENIVVSTECKHCGTDVENPCKTKKDSKTCTHYILKPITPDKIKDIEQ